EFGLVSLPILLMTFGVLELALVFLVSTSLDGAMQLASRQIRTGEFQASGGGAANFKTLVCQNMSWLQSQCAANMWLDVRTYGDFSDLASASQLTPSNLSKTNFCFQPGQPTDIVLVRAYYQWSLMTPLLNNALANLGATQRLITSTTAFRNEPYNSNPAQGASSCPPLS
ncbi:MAG: pilus assembly protein, partial [Proteobacteria bacterium]|nr:pilus assembly protein [Pseudomonadota bacterium]